MIYKFIEMLYEMYGGGFAEQIEEFADILLSDAMDLSLSDLFIVWSDYIEHSEHFDTTL